MSQSPVPPGAPTTQSQSTTREVIVAVQDLVLEAALEAGVTPIQTQEAGSPSRSLPHPIARQQVASLRSREPVLVGVGGGGGGVSITVNDLPGFQQDSLGGTLQLAYYIVAGRVSWISSEWRPWLQFY